MLVILIKTKIVILVFIFSLSTLYFSNENDQNVFFKERKICVVFMMNAK